jgi:hypothetical protein
MNNTSEIYTLNYAIALTGQLTPIKVWRMDNQDKFFINLQYFSIVSIPENISIETYRKTKIKGAKYAFSTIFAENEKLTIGIIVTKNLKIMNRAYFELR